MPRKRVLPVRDSTVGTNVFSKVRMRLSLDCKVTCFVIRYRPNADGAFPKEYSRDEVTKVTESEREAWSVTAAVQMTNAFVIFAHLSLAFGLVPRHDPAKKKKERC